MTSLRRSDVLFIALAILGVVVGAVLNPYVNTIGAQRAAALVVVALVALAAVSLEVIQSLRNNCEPVDSTVQSTPPNSRLNLYLGLLGIATSWIWLYRGWLTHPTLFADDFHYILQSIDWETARSNLLVPYNEHLVPATRIVTWILLQLDPVHPERPFAAFTVGMLLLTSTLLFFFARRIGVGDFAGLVAVASFVVSTSYSEVVTWYSASQWLISVCLLLASLLLVERPSDARLAGAILLSALAPWSYTIGVLVGPFTTFWLWTWHRRREAPSFLPALAGIASSLVAVRLIRSSMTDPDYWKSGGHGMLEAFDPVGGLVYSARLFVERLLPMDRLFGWFEATPVRSIVVFAALAVGAVAALRAKPALARLWPIAVLIGLAYAITVPFRTWQPYLGIVSWNRYQLIPSLGFSLLAAGVVGSFPRLRDAINRTMLLWFLMALALWTIIQSGVVWPLLSRVI